jgi:hypothetical protein
LKILERVFELFGRTKPNGFGLFQLHNFIGLWIANFTRFAGANAPGSKTWVAKAGILLHSFAHVVEHHVNQRSSRFLGHAGLQCNCFNEFGLGHSIPFEGSRLMQRSREIATPMRIRQHELTDKMYYFFDMINTYKIQITGFRLFPARLCLIVIGVVVFVIGCAPRVAVGKMSAAEIWVDAYAPVGGTGDKTSPLKTIPQIKSQTVLHLHSGIYEGPFVFDVPIEIIGHGQVVLSSTSGTTLTMRSGALRNLSIQGGSVGLQVNPGSSVELNHVTVTGFREIGIQSEQSKIQINTIQIESAIPNSKGLHASNGLLSAQHVSLRGSLWVGLHLDSVRAQIDDFNSLGLKTALRISGGEATVSHADISGGQGPAMVVSGTILKGTHWNITGHEFALLAQKKSAVSLQHVKLEGQQRAAIASLNSTLHLSDSEILKSGSYGALQLMDSNSTVEHVTIRQAMDVGILVRKGTGSLKDIHILGVNTSGNSEGDGIQVRDATATLSDLSISDSNGAGVFVSHYAKTDISNYISRHNHFGALMVDRMSKVTVKNLASMASQEPDVTALESCEVKIEFMQTDNEIPFWADCENGSNINVKSLTSKVPPPPSRCVVVESASPNSKQTQP